MEKKQRLFEQDRWSEKDSMKLFKDQNSEDQVHQKSTDSKEYWKILLIDDEEDIHKVTKMALKGFSYQGREIQFLQAFSAEESKDLLATHHDIALIFLDVVMETNHAGLDLVRYIRDKMHNHFTQIILRTGYPGQAPEREVIAAYEINDYKTKTELTNFKLFTATLASLRAYDSIMRLENLRKNLEVRVKERTAELEKKNVQIMEMDQMKTRFFSNISHEFRTPLTLVIGPLEDFLTDKEIPSHKRDRLEIMHQNAGRILHLVNQLLDLSRIDAGHMKLNISYHDLRKTISLITKSFIPQAERKKIRYRTEMPDHEMMCLFDRDKLEKILINLLSNAFKYTPEFGDVTFRLKINEKVGSKDTQQVEITVKDSGKGIPDGESEKIFDRFYQVEEGWKSGIGGTGIGLSLTKELVGLHHGQIDVISESGKGSCFIIHLLTGKDHLKQAEFVIVDQRSDEDISMIAGDLHDGSSGQVNTDQTMFQTGNTQSILIVEDNADLRQHIGEILSHDCNVNEAANGQEGFDKATQLIPDLIISDLMMPVMDGIAFCDKLKKDERTSHIPVVLLTAKSEISDKLQGLESGADDYIVKPFNSKELAARVKNLITQRLKLQEKYSRQIIADQGTTRLKSPDEKFLEKARKVIENNLNDSNFDVNGFFEEMGMSRMQLFRKLKALLNQTPGELIRNLRLHRAASLLKQNYGNVAEVTFEVGFNNLSYFAKCFKEKYGLLPSEYQKQLTVKSEK